MLPIKSATKKCFSNLKGDVTRVQSLFTSDSSGNNGAWELVRLLQSEVFLSFQPLFFPSLNITHSELIILSSSHFISDI